MLSSSVPDEGTYSNPFSLSFPLSLFFRFVLVVLFLPPLLLLLLLLCALLLLLVPLLLLLTLLLLLLLLPLLPYRRLVALDFLGVFFARNSLDARKGVDECDDLLLLELLRKLLRVFAFLAVVLEGPGDGVRVLLERVVAVVLVLVLRLVPPVLRDKLRMGWSTDALIR